MRMESLRFLNANISTQPPLSMYLSGWAQGKFVAMGFFGVVRSLPFRGSEHCGNYG